MNLTHVEFNLLFSIVAIPNIIVPLFGGAIIDFLGINLSMFIYCFILFVAQSIVTYAVYINHYQWMLFGKISFLYWLIIIGRFLYGAVTINVDTGVLFVINEYFAGKELSFAVGISISVGRMGTFLAATTYPHIYSSTQLLYLPFMISAGVAFLGWILSIILWILNVRREEES